MSAGKPVKIYNQCFIFPKKKLICRRSSLFLGTLINYKLEQVNNKLIKNYTTQLIIWLSSHGENCKKTHSQLIFNRTLSCVIIFTEKNYYH